MMDWKVLVAIVAVAAVGGWLVVRTMTAPPAPNARQATPLDRPAEPQGRVTALDRALPARLGDAPRGGENEFDRDVAALVAALRDDQAIQYYVFTNRERGGKMPPTMRYRRMGRFWQGAVTGVTR